jgi:hypothetical protein
MALDNDYKTVLMADDDAEDCMPASHAFMESGAEALIRIGG